MDHMTFFYLKIPMLSYSDNLISLNARFLVADVQIPGSKSGDEALNIASNSLQESVQRDILRVASVWIDLYSLHNDL